MEVCSSSKFRWWENVTQAENAKLRKEDLKLQLGSTEILMVSVAASLQDDPPNLVIRASWDSHPCIVPSHIEEADMFRQ